MPINQQLFGTLPMGEPVSLYTLENKNGISLTVTDFGGKLVSLLVPDCTGKKDDVILGFDSLAPYLVRNPYFGTLVGRCANRIRNARYDWEGKTVRLDENAAPHHLHGGAGGFDKKLWQADTVKEGGCEKLRLRLLSPDGDQGYPGNLSVTVLYSLDEENRLSLEYEAETDAVTPVNLTNHCYFNLNGHGGHEVLNHLVTINADAVTDLDEEKMVTGALLPVEGTPLDFRSPRLIGKDLHSPHRLLALTGGYDLNYVLNRREKGALEEVCRVEVPENGRGMRVFTTLPGLQLYTANYIGGDFSFTGKAGVRYDHPYCGLCLETQYHPNSVNCPAFPSVLLRPGEIYRARTVYQFTY